jgi:aminodeoxyfutalosine synthase
VNVIMTTTFEDLLKQVEGGERLSATEISALAEAADILPLGMLADSLRRRLRGTTVTYARVARGACDQSFADAEPAAASEIRITGEPSSLDSAIAAVTTAKAVAGDRVVSGFSWIDVERLARGSEAAFLGRLREAGLESLELALDRTDHAAAAIELLMGAGFQQLRLTIDKAPAEERPLLMLRAAELQDQFACVQALNPLPMVLNAMRPTTGYDDVKSVAIARLAAPNIPVIQVDWLRYGPKLAQVALTFGADDLDEVSASDESPDGRRRAPIEEVRRNIEAAGFTAAERDGRFALLA